MNFSFKIKPKVLIITSSVVSLLMIISAYLELNQSKSEIFHLLFDQTATLSETIVSSSLNALNSSDETENLIVQRLLNNARLIKELDSLNALTHEKLIKIGNANNLFRINIFDKKGDRVLTNRVVSQEDDHLHGEERVNRYKEVKQILTGEKKELIIGLKKAMHVDEKRFAVAISRSEKRGAIVVNLNATEYLRFRKKIGIERIVHDIGDNSGFEYVVLQNREKIIAASSNVKTLSTFSDDPFLNNSVSSDSMFTRITMFENSEIYEAVIGYRFENEFTGVFRIGISLDEIRSVEKRMIRRIIVISIILTTIGIILLGILFTNQNLNNLSTEFGNYKSFTNSFLQNMKESVITISNDSKITLFNTSAETLFSVSRKNVVGKQLDEIDIEGLRFIGSIISNGTEAYKNLEIKTVTNYGEKYLSVIVTPNYNLSKGLESKTVIINDITESKLAEEQAKRNEKLIAMGKLGSDVAHEVRNPINSIGMIAQRLKNEFKPKNESDEYNLLTELLKEEVNRINKIITQFLRYAKPLDLHITKVNIHEFMTKIYQLFAEQAKQRKILFNINGEKDLFARIDNELFKQAMINIIQNAFEAVEDNGKVIVKYFKKDNSLFFYISDNGKEIDKKDQPRIFDLYFTKKKQGTGLGLSISQKIISQHNGVISFTTVPKETTFKIKIPMT